MSRATRTYLREQNAINEAQGVEPEDAPEVEEKHIDLIVRHPSMHIPSFPSDVDAGRRKNSNSDAVDRGPAEIAANHPISTEPLWRGSTRSSLNGSAQSSTSLGSGGASSSGTHGRSQLSASDNTTRHKDGGLVFNSLSERHTSKNNASNGTTLPDDGTETWDDFRPHILHDPHDPVPIAIVNRWPTGSKCLFP